LSLQQWPNGDHAISHLDQGTPFVLRFKLATVCYLSNQSKVEVPR